MTAIYKLGGLICNITYQTKSAAGLFANVESFSAILKCFHRSETSEDAHWIAVSINNIINHSPSSNKLLNSLPVVEAFSFIIPLAECDGAVYWISKALLQIFENNEEAQKKFGTPEFFKIFRGMKKHVTRSSKKSFEKVVRMLKPK